MADSYISGLRWPWRRSNRQTTSSRPLLEHGAVPWLLTIALFTTLPHFAAIPGWLSLIAGTALIGRAGIWWRNIRLPKRWMLTLMVLVGTAGIAWHYRSLFGREPGIALLVFFMALKPMEMTTRRDGLVIVMLGFFLLLTHYFEAENIITGVWLLVSAILLTAVLLRLYGGARPIVDILKYATLLIAQAVPFMLIFFLLFPRVQGPLWGMPQDAYSGMTGLSDQMSPGSLDSLIQSGAIAFRARFDTALPKRSQLYWRGPVFDSYDGTTWKASPASSYGSTRRTPTIEALGESSIGYTLTLEAHNRRWLLALDLPVSLPEGATVTPTLEVLARTPVLYRSRFIFRSAPDYRANVEESPRLLQQALRLPSGLNARTSELAASWRQKFSDPERISAEALRFFREEPFYYTLQPPRLGANAVDEFLFETRRGFCEHYASAFVYLMRAAGIPARVVAGYQGGELNPVDNYLTVRQSDAHAWAEIWLENKGWLRVDPTAAIAPSRIERGIGAALPEDDPLPALVRLDNDWLAPLVGLRYRWEAANNAWNQWVIGYNPERQREALARLGMKDADWREMISLMVLLSGIALIAVVTWVFVRRTRVAPEVRAWQNFCSRLARHGIQRADWEGPFDLATRVAQERPSLAGLVARAAMHYAELRYGNAHPDHLRQLRECSRQLASLREKTP